MLKSARTKAIIALIIANIVWGAASPIFKWSLTNIPPFALAILRFGFASLILLPLVFKKLKKISRVDLPKIFVFSLCSVTMNISFFFLGLRLAPSINASLIGSTSPFIILAVGALLLKENVEPREIFGTIVSFLGVMVIIFSPVLITKDIGELASIGNFFFFLATLGAAGQAFFGKQLFKKYEPLLITFLSFFIGALTFIPFLFYEWQNNPAWITDLQFPGIFGIVYGIIFSSAIAYCLYNWGLSKIEVSETGIFTYLAPVTAIFVAVPFFGEKITLPFLVGSILVFLGVISAEKRFSEFLLNNRG